MDTAYISTKHVHSPSNLQLTTHKQTITNEKNDDFINANNHISSIILQ